MANVENSISLPFEQLDDLIYYARAGDLESLQNSVSNLSKEHNCSPAAIIEAAIDSEPESEGGTGSCLFHWPAANGNLQILQYLIGSVSSKPELSEHATQIINHKNYSGNTSLHWAALNTHLECVQALVAAGARIDLKNNAGHDAVFLAERADWSQRAAENENSGEEEGAMEVDGDEKEKEAEADDTVDPETQTAAPASKALQVAEWLLNCEKGSELEKGATAEDDEVN
ncbi:hypothetical protein FQN57_007279 [Myotisia sp. PD_48]|nr:hypothetical protein FQN57_007279 [Myotisia sp. PD_48]